MFLTQLSSRPRNARQAEVVYCLQCCSALRRSTEYAAMPVDVNIVEYCNKDNVLLIFTTTSLSLLGLCTGTIVVVIDIAQC